jgi:hypothetical protein
LAPSLAELKSDYLELGYSEEEAKDFLAYQEFGLIPEEWQGRIAVTTMPAASEDSTGGESGASTQQPVLAQNVNVSKRNNILFSSSINIGDCYLLESSHEGMSFEDAKFNFAGVGGTWEELANNIDIDLPEAVKVKVLIIARDIFCGSSGEATVKIECPEFETDPESYAINDLKKVLADGDPFWKKITERVDSEIDAAYHPKIYTTLIKTFCHD